MPDSSKNEGETSKNSAVAEAQEQTARPSLQLAATATPQPRSHKPLRSKSEAPKSAPVLIGPVNRAPLPSEMSYEPPSEPIERIFIPKSELEAWLQSTAKGTIRGSSAPLQMQTMVDDKGRPVKGAPTWSTAMVVAAREQKAHNERHRIRVIIFWALVSFFAIIGYAWYAIQRVRATRFQRHQEKLQSSIAMFPKNPYEYNERQRMAFARNYWRRFNIRNITLLVTSVLTSLGVARWHRARRAQMQKRKSLAYWMWTAGAGFLAILWGVYVVKQSQRPVIISAARRNPVLRGFLYIGGILLVYLFFYIYRLKKRKSKKQKMLDEWRKKKHMQTMQKAKDLHGPLKPLSMPPPGK